MEKLKQLREERGLSQVKLAARADLNPATVNQIERGMRDASPGTLRKLADALEVSLYDLLEEEAPIVLAPQPEEVSGGERRVDSKPPPITVNLESLVSSAELKPAIVRILESVATGETSVEEGVEEVLREVRRQLAA
jgi:transcriptional regulator with XRE-family HTH domain